MASRCLVVLAIVVFFAVIGSIAAQEPDSSTDATTTTDSATDPGKDKIFRDLLKCDMIAKKTCLRKLVPFRPLTFQLCVLEYYEAHEAECSVNGIKNQY